MRSLYESLYEGATSSYAFVKSLQIVLKFVCLFVCLFEGRRSTTLTPVAERLAVELSLPVFNDFPIEIRTPISRMRGKRR